jgi:hypothetical protein
MNGVLNEDLERVRYAHVLSIRPSTWVFCLKKKKAKIEEIIHLLVECGRIANRIMCTSIRGYVWKTITHLILEKNKK